MNIEIANRLVELRKKQGFSQEDLAFKIGVSRQAISKWERAETSPDTDNLINLARLYKVSLDEILGIDTVIVKAEIKNEVQPQDRNIALADLREEDFYRTIHKFPCVVIVTNVYKLSFPKSNKKSTNEISCEKGFFYEKGEIKFLVISYLLGLLSAIGAVLPAFALQDMLMYCLDRFRTVSFEQTISNNLILVLVGMGMATIITVLFFVIQNFYEKNIESRPKVVRNTFLFIIASELGLYLIFTLVTYMVRYI